MPFSQLTALHVTFKVIGEQPQHIPLLKDCLSLQVISIKHPQDTLYSRGIVLPRSCATHFAFLKHDVAHEQWLKQDIFDSLPNLRHLLLQDYPSQVWYIDSEYELRIIQRENGQIIDYLVNGACPVLESIKLKNFSVLSDVLWNLIDKRPSLYLTYSSFHYTTELTAPRHQESWHEVGSDDDPKTFFGPWVTFTPDSEDDENAW
jgi:hypothetical protein